MCMCLCMLLKRGFKAWSNETWPVRAKHCLGMWFHDHSLILNTYIYGIPSLQTLSRRAVFHSHLPCLSALLSCCSFPSPLTPTTFIASQGAQSPPQLLQCPSFSQHKYCFLTEGAALTEAQEEV